MPFHFHGFENTFIGIHIRKLFITLRSQRYVVYYTSFVSQIPFFEHTCIGAVSNYYVV